MREKALPVIVVLFIVLASFSITLYIMTKGLDNEVAARDAALKEKVKVVEGLVEKIEQLEGEIEHFDAAIDEKGETIASLEEDISYSKKGTFYIVGYSKQLERGLVMPMEVELNHGQGRVLLDTGGMAVDKDTKLSMRIAKTVAQRVTGADLADKDVIFTIDNGFPVAVEMEGPSAGAAMTLLLISVLEDRPIKEGYLITGVINYNGTIGRVAFIPNKVQGAKEFNATTLVVPPGLGVEVEGLKIMEAWTIQEAAEIILEP